MEIQSMTISLPDACKALGISETTLRRISCHGEGLKLRYLGSKPVVVKAELEAFLADLPTRPVNRTILSHDRTAAET
jgi:hypothetical protein